MDMKNMIKEIIREEMNKNTKIYHFMAGLPRSGSTLLSAILNQNPNIHSGPSSPVVPTMLAIEISLSNDELFLAYPKPEQASKIISCVLDNFYSDISAPVIIDKNRSWIDKINYIRGYFNIQKPKILYPVRDIKEILASFISMHKRNLYKGSGKLPFPDESLVKSNLPLSDDVRCEFLCGNMGIIGQSYNGLKKCFLEGNDDCVHIIEYNELIIDPETTMRKIYDYLEMDYYEHDFNNLVNLYRENDLQVYGLEDMHEVRKKLEKVSTTPEDILPENVLEKLKNLEFWRKNDIIDYDKNVDFNNEIGEDVNSEVQESFIGYKNLH